MTKIIKSEELVAELEEDLLFGGTKNSKFDTSCDFLARPEDRLPNLSLEDEQNEALYCHPTRYRFGMTNGYIVAQFAYNVIDEKQQEGKTFPDYSIERGVIYYRFGDDPEGLVCESGLINRAIDVAQALKKLRIPFKEFFTLPNPKDKLFRSREEWKEELYQRINSLDERLL